MKHINFKSLIVLFLVLFGISPNLWAGAGYYQQDGKNSTLELQVNGGNSTWIDRTNNADTWVINDALYTMTLKTFYVYVWQEYGTGISWTKMYYNIHKDGQTTDWSVIDGGYCADKGGNNKEFGKKDINMDILANCTEPGTYYLDYNFDTDNAGQLKNQKNSGNFCVKFTIPDYWINHRWGDLNSWSWKKLNINNYDGTYSIKDYYGGTGCNYDTKSGGQSSPWVGSPTVNGASKGDYSLFTFNRKTKAITITKILTVTYNGNGATGGNLPTNPEVLYGGSVRLSSNQTGKLVRTGYTLTGWNTQADGQGTHYDLNQELTNFTSSLSLYAEWTPKTYTITLDKNNGTEDGSASVDYNNTNLTSISHATRTGYDLQGYYTSTSDGTKVLNADGSFAAQTISGYITSGKWTKAADCKLYAQWTAHTYTVTLNANGGTANGSVQATYDGGLSTYNAATGDQNLTGYFTETTGGYKIIDETGSLVSGTVSGWVTSGKWANANATQTLYAQWQSKATLSFNKNTTNAVSNMPTSMTENPGIVTLPATEPSRVGYTFEGWDIDKTATTGAYKAGTTFNLQTNTELFAIWKVITYTITYNNVEETEYTNPTTYTIETETIELQDASRDDYTFDGWFDAETEGNKVTSIEQGSTGDKILWARWSETLHDVNIVASTGIESTTPSGATKIGNVTPVQISAVVKEGYTWNQWNMSGSVTVADVNANPTTIKATGEGSVTATATENMSTITISSNNTDYGTVNVNNASVGVTTTKQLVATNKYGYKFKEWDLQGGVVLATGAKTDATITIKGDGNSTAGTAQAIFEEDLSSDWQLNFSHDGWHLYDFVKETGQSTGNVAYYSIDLEIDKNYEFEIRKKSSDTYYKNTGKMTATNCTNWTFTTTATSKAWLNTSVAGTYKFKIDFSGNNPVVSVIYPDVTCIQGEFDGWSRTAHAINEANNWTTTVNITQVSQTLRFRLVWHGAYYSNTGTMTSENCTGWTFEKELSRNYCEIKTTVAGNYTFSLNTSDKKLSITYPGEEHHTVIVDNGESTKEVDVKEVTETPLVAKQYLNGMRFDRWVVTNSEGVVQENKITINHPENYSTHMHGATEDGLIVKATYTTQGIVYLDKQYIKGDWPGDVFVYFYKGAYWDDTNKELGSGSKQAGANCISDGKQMTRVNDKSDIYYYDYSGDNLTNRAEYISFVDQREDGYANFVACQAIYRGDFQECSPMFVPRNWKYYYNRDAPTGRAVYYQEGYWRTYNSTDAGLSLHFWKGSEETVVPFTSESKNDNTFTAKITINDALGDNSYFKLRCCGGAGDNMDYWYGCKSGMSATSCTNYRFYSGNNTENVNCGIGLTSTGDYIFKLSLADGQVFVSVEYPLSNGDYRLVSVTNGKVHDNGKFYKSSTDRVDTASFFITKDHTSLVKLQKCTDATSVPAKWEDVDGKSIATSGYETGIYNFTFTQSSESSKEIAKLGEYTGDFYIRTAIAAGGWDAYKGSADNLLPYIEYGLDESQPFKFTHAYTNWVDVNKNVKFCIANDYSLCISDTLVGDDILGTGDGADWLKNGANIRFMWNKNTNDVKRAYISGSTNDADRFLMLEGDAKMFDDKGQSLTNNELKFTDKNNWVYQADIKAQPQCAVKLTAKYNSKTQYFIGSDTESKEIISGTGDKKYKMRAVYDFKTNRLTAGWIPDDAEIDAPISLGGDMLLVREHQGKASQITFGETGSVSDIHHIYSVLTIKKDTMLGKDGTKYPTAATNTDYERTMYWISFPFDVKISEVFGVDGYGKKWIMQRYNGEKRAEIGWFQETETFWEYLAPTSTLKAYKGYLLILNANYFNTEGADVWKNSATEANFYFPSAEKNIGIINKSSVDVPVPAHVCGIDRPFADDPEKNHKITDSYWNVIGVPAFQDAPAVATLAEGCNLKSYYKWNSTNNTYDAETVDVDAVQFKTMHAYMVQFGGTLTWENVSVVNNPTPAQGGSAPRYTYADTKNYRIELFFNGNGAEDHTYINLSDEAATDFVLNEDMMKIDNAGYPNIYSFAGAYDVAYNETKMIDQVVTIGVSAPADGSYTFSMPKDFSGSAILVDLEEGTATDLNVSNYSVDLNKGTYNNRFQLMLKVEASTPTNIDNVDGAPDGLEWNADGKTKKLLINDNIYLINAGRIYNATGTMVR